MPVVKRVRGAKSTNPLVVAPTRGEEIKLPSSRSVPMPHLGDYTILMYGAKKIGKTTMWRHAPATLHLMFEPGGRALRLYQLKMESWSKFVGTIDALEVDTKFKTVVVDIVDIAYEHCFAYMCEKLGITHPTDESDFGKSWGQIQREFTLQFSRLLSLDKGIVMLSHSTTHEVKRPSGEKFDRIEPTMSGQARKYLLGIVDIWAYYGYNGTEREIRIRGDDFVGAGCRLEENFNTPAGKPVVSIPGGSSSKEAFDNFVRAFQNQQPKSRAELLVRSAQK